MLQNPPELLLPCQLTQTPRQLPEQSLRVISNYSSLERMYNKIHHNKILASSHYPKRDSANINGWVTSFRDKKDQKHKNLTCRSKFATIDYSQALPSPTLSPKSVNLEHQIRKLSSKSQQKNRSQTIRGTNFKYSARSHDQTNRTISFLSDERPLTHISPQHKKQWINTYYKEAVKKRMERTMWWPSNPEAVSINPTQFPMTIDHKLKGNSYRRPGKRNLRKEEFKMRFGIS